ncbi:hypothetical protein DF186_19515, partial [Enterococcus hirae]
GDVARLGGFLRDTRQHLADADFRPVGHRDDGAGGQEITRRNIGTGQVLVLAVGIHQLDHRSQVATGGTAVLGLGDHDVGQTGRFV